MLGALDSVVGDEDVVINAAGSLPGDLHKLWRARSPRQYHLEYGYSCMGYEIPGAIGVRLAAPDRPVWALVGDGTYLMLPTELVTAVQEGVNINVVLLQNHGYASIGGLSEQTGAERFGTAYRYRAADGTYTGEPLPVDLAANAASLGMDVIRAETLGELRAATRGGAGVGRSDVRVRRDGHRPGSAERPGGVGLVGRGRRRDLRPSRGAQGPRGVRTPCEQPTASPVSARPSSPSGTAAGTRRTGLRDPDTPPNQPSRPKDRQLPEKGHRMKTLGHWIGGKAVESVSGERRTRLQPRHRRSAHAGRARLRRGGRRSGRRGAACVRGLVAAARWPGAPPFSSSTANCWTRTATRSPR